MMKNYFKVVIVLMMVCFINQSLSLFASDKKADEIIKKVKDNYDELKTFQAHFSQSSYWKLADDVHQQNGKIWLKGKDKFKIETEDQTVVSDGKTIWTHSQFNNQVIIDNVEKSGEDVRLPKDIFFKYSEDYTPVFVQDEKIGDQDCRVIELRAKTEDIFMKFMKIWIDLKLSVPVKIEQVDINGNSTTYLLSNIQINDTIDDNFFIYKTPESIEIIDMR